MALPEDHLAKFHKMSDAKEMWDAIKSRFGGNDESKKMQKYILKQQFEGFSVSSSEGIHKGYDIFQSLLSQLEIHGAGVSTEDANKKFLRSLPSVWSQVSLVMRTKPRVDSLCFDDLYNNLRVFKSDVKGSTASSLSSQNVAFVSENTSSTNDVSTAYGVSNSSSPNSQHEQTSSYSLLVNQSSCSQLDHEDLKQLDEFDLEEMDLKWQVAMISMRMKKFYKKTGRKLQFDAKEPVGFDKTKVECYNCHKTGHFARECRTKGNQDSRRRDGWNSRNKGKEIGRRSGNQENSKALVTIDGEGVDWTSHSEEDYNLMPRNRSKGNQDSRRRDAWNTRNKEKDNGRRFGKQEDSKALVTLDGEGVDWTSHLEDEQENYAFMACNSSGSDTEYRNTAHNTLKKVEAQLVAHQQGQLCEETHESMPETVVNEPTVVSQPKVWSDAPIIEEYESDSEDEHVSLPTKEQEIPSFADKHVKTPRQIVKEQNTCSQSPNTDKKDCSGLMSKKLGLGFGYTKKACFVYGSFSHLIRDYDFHEKMMAKQAELNNRMSKGSSQREIRPVWNNVQRMNHQNQFVPKEVLTRTGKIPVNTARTSDTNTVNTARHIFNIVLLREKGKLLLSPQQVVIGDLKDITGTKSPNTMVDQTLADKGIVDMDVPGTMTGNKAYLAEYKTLMVALLPFVWNVKVPEDNIGCRHMTGNKAYLAEYQDFNGGPIDFGGEFKNRDFIEFCGSKGIKREYSNARTPQQNRVAERKNRTLIEAARTMLADSFLPNTFWAEAVSTACYVLNRVLVTKPHNKTPYELVTGKGPTWLFDLDYLTDLMNCQPVRSENQANKHAGPQEANHNAGTNDNINAGDSEKEDESAQDYFVLPIWSSYSSTIKRSTTKDAREAPNKHLDLKTDEKPVDKEDQVFLDKLERLKRQEKDANDAAKALRKEFAQETENLLLQAGTAKVSSTDIVNTISTPVSTASPYDGLSFSDPTNPDQDESEIPALEDIYKNLTDGIFTNSSYDDEGAVAGFTNLEHVVNVSPIPTSRINFIHPSTLILGDPQSAVQTRSKVTKSSGAHAFVSYIQKQRKNNHRDFQHYLFACFLSQNEPKKISKALEDESWVDAMQEELLQFKIQKVWILVDLPYRKKAIGTKWVYRNKKDERGVVVRNKLRLVAQGHMQEEGIDYDEVFALVARIEAIRIFLAFASYMGFIVYQRDVKSVFLYGKIDEEVYVSQPPGFIDPKSPKKNGYRRGTIDKTLFIKKDKNDIMLVQVYVDDIIFGSTKKSWCDEFEALMKSRFQMSSMGELTFFLGLQVKQKEDGIFISQDKYVAEILKKFDFVNVKTASTPIETQKPLVKDEEASDVDVHLYRSMIGSLMYLTASRPDIMFAVCACSRFQVTPKTSHLHAVKRIFRYLKGKPKLGLWYPRVSSFDLEAYSDSDYAGANLDRKSTTGGCQFLGRRLISWQCKKQTIVATSTTEAEYVAAANCCGQVLWIQNQMLDYGFNFMNTKIYIDNESTICIVKNPVYHLKTKHIKIRHHFIRDVYEKKLIQVLKIHTDDNVADLLTKDFDVSRFQFLVVTIGMINP
ncbi:putative ribonuclease H-like domain-containing protein [Tanacetum coccineum]